MDLSDYLSTDQAAKRLGVTRATLDRWQLDATDTEFTLGDPDGEFPTKVWHISKWRRLEASRLEQYIVKAVEAGLVVRKAEHDLKVSAAYQKGSNDGFEEAKALSKSVEWHEVDPDSEDAEVKSIQPVPMPNADKFFNLEGLTVGGFTPIV